ncbi:hypothetical protein ACFL6U_16200 [Planctomycetota bacterium]
MHAQTIHLEVWRAPSGRGSVLLMVVFVIALMAATVMGVLQLNSEEIQLMGNHTAMAESHTMAEAGLQHALARLRMQANWTQGFHNQPFADGQYTVTVDNWRITSTGRNAQGFATKVTADITIDAAGPPHAIRIDALRINE